jgi:hypothetical protein
VSKAALPQWRACGLGGAFVELRCLDSPRCESGGSTTSRARRGHRSSSRQKRARGLGGAVVEPRFARRVGIAAQMRAELADSMEPFWSRRDLPGADGSSGFTRARV